VLSQKFVEEFSGENAGPSTTFVAKNAPIFAPSKDTPDFHFYGWSGGSCATQADSAFLGEF
jgi:hypothetical protein